MNIHTAPTITWARVRQSDPPPFPSPDRKAEASARSVCWGLCFLLPLAIYLAFPKGWEGLIRLI